MATAIAGYEYRGNHSVYNSPDYYTRVSTPASQGTVTFRGAAFVMLNPKFETTFGSSFLATTDFGSTVPVGCFNNWNVTNYINNGNCYNSNIIAQRAAMANIITENTNTSLKLWPNPANDYFYINLNARMATSNVIVHMLDNVGIMQKIKYIQEGNHLKVYALAGLASGQYTINIISNKEVTNAKVTIAK